MRGAWCPASVNASVPLANSKSASVIRAGGFASRASQRNRPAIIRCRTRNHSPSSARTRRLPRRRTSTTRLPATSDDRRHGRAQHERIENPRAFEALRAHARGERIAVGLEIRQLGHRGPRQGSAEESARSVRPNQVTALCARNFGLVPFAGAQDPSDHLDGVEHVDETDIERQQAEAQNRRGRGNRR